MGSKEVFSSFRKTIGQPEAKEKMSKVWTRIWRSTVHKIKPRQLKKGSSSGAKAQ